MNLRIRDFVPNQDESIWADIENRAWKEDPDHTSVTAEQVRERQKAPWYNPAGRLIAELEARPVAKVLAHIDKKRVENRGFLEGPDVVPEARRRGIGALLAKEAFASLKARGMVEVEAGTPDWNKAAQGFLDSLGFRRVRVFSLMAANLGSIPRNVGENTEAELVPGDRNRNEARLVARLQNETFREHYNYRPASEDEEFYWLQNEEKLGYRSATCFARIAGNPVGFVIYGIDKQENELPGVNRGWLFSLGVLKPFRNQGIAKAMTIHGMRELKGMGLKEARLGVDDANVTHAFRLYERLGFHSVRKRYSYLRKLV